MMSTSIWRYAAFILFSIFCSCAYLCNGCSVALQAQLPNGLSDVMSLKFVPGVRVTPETLQATELQEQDLTITGLDKVLQKVEVSGHTYICTVQYTNIDTLPRHVCIKSKILPTFASFMLCNPIEVAHLCALCEHGIYDYTNR